MRLVDLSAPLLALTLGLAFGCSSSSTPQTTPTDDAGADTAPTPAAYPEGPYGLLRGNIFPNLTFKGHRDGVGDLVDISMSDYFDPDGKKGITGVYFIVAAQWCGPCNIEAENAPKIYEGSYRKRGARYVSVVIEDTNGKPSTEATLDAWISDHKITFDMGLLPSAADHSSLALPDGPNVGLPHNYIIDPRNMGIQSITQGVDAAVWSCDMYKPGGELSAEGCCLQGVTKYTDGSDVCTVDYTCLKGKVCLPPGDTSPSRSMEVVMSRNGAAPFGG